MADRSIVVATLSALSVVIAGLVVPLTILRERYEGDGYLWAWADVANDSWLLLLLCASFGGLAAVGVRSGWVRRLTAPPDLFSTVLGAAAGFALGAFVPLLIARPVPEYSFETAVIAVVVAVVCLVVGLLTSNRAGLAFLIVATALLVHIISAASDHVDNSDRPVDYVIAMVVLASPLLAAVVNQRVRGGTGIGLAIFVVHLIGLAPVIAAAAACDDDDCIPAPGWLIAAALVAVWSLAASWSTPAAPEEPSADSKAAVESGSRSLGVGLSVGAALPFVVVASALIVAARVDLDAPPAPLAATTDAVEAMLPGMIGWTSDRLCVDEGGSTNPMSSRTATIAGSGIVTKDRVEVCYSVFEGWSFPSPQAHIEQFNTDFLLDPVSVTFTDLVTSYSVDPIDPPGPPVRYGYVGRGVHRFWSGADGDGSEVLLFEVSAGRDYSIRAWGFSDDGTWFFVVDSLGRLIVMPVDGSITASVLDDRVSNAQSVDWGPGTSFEPNPTIRLTNPGDTTYVPDSADMNEARAMINDQARRFGDEASVDFVVVDGRVYGQFRGLPDLDETERGLCVWLTTWLNSAGGERFGVSAIVGDGGMACVSEAESDGYRCGNVLTLPTVATVDQLTGSDALSGRASLMIPITFPSDPLPFTGLRRENDDWSIGPVTPSDLVELSLADVSC